MPDKSKDKDMELVKVPVMPGDAVFVEYKKGQKPNIRVFNRAIPRGCLS